MTPQETPGAPMTPPEARADVIATRLIVQADDIERRCTDRSAPPMEIGRAGFLDYARLMREAAALLGAVRLTAADAREEAPADLHKLITTAVTFGLREKLSADRIVNGVMAALRCAPSSPPDPALPEGETKGQEPLHDPICGDAGCACLGRARRRITALESQLAEQAQALSEVRAERDLAIQQRNLTVSALANTVNQIDFMKAAQGTVREALEKLVQKWVAEGASKDAFHATMGIGWKACAADLAAVLASPASTPTSEPPACVTCGWLEREHPPGPEAVYGTCGRFLAPTSGGVPHPESEQPKSLPSSREDAK